MTPRTLLGHRG